uniref:Uncharacterized protein n=1 Tax=Ditylenchus dipsaci TaxID=166011 RepID=A0A915DYT9_9BILA
MHYQSFQRATRATLRLPPLRSTLAQTDEQGGQVFDTKYGRKVSLQHHYFQPHEYNGLMRKLSEQTSHLGYNYTNGAPRKYSPSPGYGSSPGVSPIMDHPSNLKQQAAPPKPARRPPYRHSLAVPSLSDSGSIQSIEDSQNKQLAPLIDALSSQLKLDLSQLDNEQKSKLEVSKSQKCTAKMNIMTSGQQSETPNSVVLLRLSPVVAHI